MDPSQPRSYALRGNVMSCRSGANGNRIHETSGHPAIGLLQYTRPFLTSSETARDRSHT